MDESELTDKERCWLENYLATLNASEAARECYACTNESARTIGCRNLAKMRELVNERLRELLPNAEDVLTRISAIAFGDISPYLSADGTVDIERLIADRKGYLIEGVAPVRGGVKWTFSDKAGALRMLARYHKLLSADVHVTLEDTSMPTKDTLDALTAQLLALEEQDTAEQAAAAADQDDAGDPEP